MKKPMFNNIIKISSLLVFLLAAYILKIALGLYHDFCANNSDGIYMFLDGTYFPEKEFITFIFLMLLGLNLFRKSMYLFKPILYFIIVLPIYYVFSKLIITIFKFTFNISYDIFSDILLFFGMLFIFSLVSEYIYHIDWKTIIKKMNFSKLLLVGLIFGILKSVLTLTDNLCIP